MATARELVPLLKAHAPRQQVVLSLLAATRPWESCSAGARPPPLWNLSPLRCRRNCARVAPSTGTTKTIMGVDRSNQSVVKGFGLLAVAFDIYNKRRAGAAR